MILVGLKNIKILILLLPRGVHSESEVLPLNYFGGSVFSWH